MAEEEKIPQENSKSKISNPKEEEVSETTLPAGQAGSPPATTEQTESQIEKSLPDLPSKQAGGIPKSEIENMEVHHHPNVEKKNFKEYLLEGLMIFLAVSMGFFAENIREGITESKVEKEYAQELYAELKDDSVVAATKLFNRLQKEKDMDYLSSYFKDSSLTNLPKKFYPAYTTSLYLINTYAFEPKDGILSQLRNSGSLRYFKSVALQKLLGDISVNINNIRERNEQEYQYFASPIKQFMLKYYDWSWLDNLRKEDSAAVVLEVINNYLNSDRNIESKILNLSMLDRAEASNMVLFYKQMLVSTRSLQLNNYIVTNHKILHLLRETYTIENE